MAKYTVPVCQCCAGELEYCEGHSIEENYKITKSGKRAKRMNEFGRTYVLKDFTVLACTSCGARYETDYDERDRIILGEMYD